MQRRLLKPLSKRTANQLGCCINFTLHCEKPELFGLICSIQRDFGM